MTHATPPRRLITAAFSTMLAVPLVAAATTPAATPPSAPSAASAITYYSDDPASWGTPSAWQAPVYPKPLLEQQVTGRVDVLVNVSPEGRVSDIVAIRSQPAQPAFEEAVREAVLNWTFTKALDESCKPTATQGRVQVRFEIADGKPKVDVGAAPAAKVPGRVFIQEANRSEVNRALVQNYPRDARRLGKMGEVLALLKVDARTGETKSVEIVEVFADNATYNPQPSMTPVGQNQRLRPRSSPASIQFATTAREELAALRFSPVAEVGQDTITVCREVAFRIRGVTRN
ncbi:MAG: TonB family protein [Betaproteobacteria bacterium]|nr:TonB family protein [Betaproteobacteria bacterium]